MFWNFPNRNFCFLLRDVRHFGRDVRDVRETCVTNLPWTRHEMRARDFRRSFSRLRKVSHKYAAAPVNTRSTSVFFEWFSNWNKTRFFAKHWDHGRPSTSVRNSRIEPNFFCAHGKTPEQSQLANDFCSNDFKKFLLEPFLKTVQKTCATCDFWICVVN